MQPSEKFLEVYAAAAQSAASKRHAAKRQASDDWNARRKPHGDKRREAIKQADALRQQKTDEAHVAFIFNTESHGAKLRPILERAREDLVAALEKALVVKSEKLEELLPLMQTPGYDLPFREALEEALLQAELEHTSSVEAASATFGAIEEKAREEFNSTTSGAQELFTGLIKDIDACWQAAVDKAQADWEEIDRTTSIELAAVNKQIDADFYNARRARLALWQATIDEDKDLVAQLEALI